ncbi:regulator of cell cycle RGCC-like [Sceloporus undulatus]|uniref:regulator of cell cycle RGCC-like n=1 Tax=Sceloporus undulatus TaxID=8520 RepID=UPI001C4CD196|nr:regulator of cell cycle RGCC-like [Sceloporus undulatus]
MENRTQRETGLSTESLDDLLIEFDQVVQDFDKGAPSQYEHHLAELKRQTLPSAYDSGIDDSESSSASPGSSLNTSEEDLNTPNTLTTTSSYSKAKLGDTQELEAFIADLDKVLEEM